MTKSERNELELKIKEYDAIQKQLDEIQPVLEKIKENEWSTTQITTSYKMVFNLKYSERITKGTIDMLEKIVAELEEEKEKLHTDRD